jgi:predicted naringenin-chalcone synthase
VVTCCAQGHVKLSLRTDVVFSHARTWDKLPGEVSPGHVDLIVTKNSSFFATSRVDKLLVGKLSQDTLIQRLVFVDFFFVVIV